MCMAWTHRTNLQSSRRNNISCRKQWKWKFELCFSKLSTRYSQWSLSIDSQQLSKPSYAWPIRTRRWLLEYDMLHIICCKWYSAYRMLHILEIKKSKFDWLVKIWSMKWLKRKDQAALKCWKSWLKLPKQTKKNLLAIRKVFI